MWHKMEIRQNGFKPNHRSQSTLHVNDLNTLITSRWMIKSQVCIYVYTYMYTYIYTYILRPPFNINRKGDRLK